MKSRVAAAVLCVGVWMGMTGLAFAQADASRKSIGITAQSAFGNVTSQAFGVEAAWGLSPRLDIYGEAGRAVSVTPKGTGDAAQLVATSLAGQTTNVGFTIKEPLDFFDVGVRYKIPTSGKLKPYLLAAVGVGMAKPDAEFTVNGASVNNKLDQYGIVLGKDLSGTTTKFMFAVGAGARYPLGARFYADAEVRYNRVMISDGAIPFGRAGLGLGVRF